MNEAVAVPTQTHATRNGALLWGAQLVSATGDALFIPCIAWLAGSASGAEASVGIAVFIATVPHLLFGPLAGAWADRADRRRIMVGSDLARAALLLALPAAAAAVGGLSFGLIVAVAFLLAAFSAPFLAARDAFLPELVPASQLPRWNALLQTSGYIALIVGLSLGGLLLALRTSGTETERVLWVLRVDALTFLVSALLLLFIVRPRRPPGPLRTAGGFWAQALEGLRYARRDKVVGGLLVLTALDNLAIMGPAIVGAALLIQRVYGLEPQHLTWFEGAMGIGMLGAALVLARIGPRVRMSSLILWGMVVDGVTYLPFLWIEDYTWALAAILLHGVAIPMIVVGRTSLLQRHVPDAQRARVFALVNVTVLGMTSLSALASGWIAGALGTRTLFGLAGVFGALSGFAGMRWLGRRLAAAERATP